MTRKLRVQMALLFEPQRVVLYNVTCKCEEPESLPIVTAEKQWICTADGAALLALYRCHDKGESVWVMDAYALESSESQPLFHQIMFQQPVADLKEAVRSSPIAIILYQHVTATHS